MSRPPRRPPALATRRPKTAGKPARGPARSGPSKVVAVKTRQLVSLRRELEKRLAEAAPPRFNANPDDVQRSMARLVLALVEFLRKLMERQALRRVDAGTLSPAEIESLGLALMRLEETVAEMARRFGLTVEELNLDLGPLGRLS